jgi:beta-lactamase superfamily II metal-dependent hydrolase
MDRRDFIKTSALAGTAFLLDWRRAFAAGTADAEAGRVWKGWKKGHFQVHVIYTGVAESMFMIFPDGTTMLLDCGDHNAVGRGKLAVPVVPSPDRHSGEWIARYVERVNPNGSDVDYMMLSHYHCDHAGDPAFNAGIMVRDGEEYPLSGFTQAAERLRFHKAVDRAWPTYDEPLPMPDEWQGHIVGHMRSFYRREQARHGLQVEKFRVGETGQIALLRDPKRYPGFSVRNLCGNGKIAAPDGTVRDLYAEVIKEPGFELNENGMSLGIVISYGKFRFYTAGDFCDHITRSDGSRLEIEEELAKVCGPVEVAKINHHGHYSMPAPLVSALRPKVWVCCVWDQLHNVAPVMERLADRSLYPGDRVVCPGIFPAERRAEDAGNPWLADIEPACFDGAHVILDVEEGGKRYSVSCVDARDESMTVRSVLRFKTGA